MVCEKKRVVSTKVTKCISAVMLLQCVLLLIYLLFTQSPKDRAPAAKGSAMTQVSVHKAVHDDNKKSAVNNQKSKHHREHEVRKIDLHEHKKYFEENTVNNFDLNQHIKGIKENAVNRSQHNLIHVHRKQDSVDEIHSRNFSHHINKAKHLRKPIKYTNNAFIIDNKNHIYNQNTHFNSSLLNNQKHSNVFKPHLSSKLTNKQLARAHNISVLKQMAADEKNTLIKYDNLDFRKFVTISDISTESDNSVDEDFWKKGFARNLFENYNPAMPGTRVLLTDTKPYLYKVSDNATCLTRGTVFHNGSQYCTCKPGWFGPNCSVPECVYTSFSYKYSDKPILRTRPKRLINAIIFNMEWELLEARMHELGGVVDMFVILESNYTMYGDPKPLRLLNQLKKGYLKQFHYKIIYVFLGHFPEKGKEDGWITDRYLRNYIGSQWMKQLTNIKYDDVFVYTDTDELPSVETMLFLKLHDGYGEPFGLTLRWSVYGFFWRQMEPTRIMVGSSVGFLQKVLRGNVYDLRTVDYAGKYSAQLQNYYRNGGRTNEWYLGDGPNSCGWHCSWCMPPQSIVIKLTSAINADFPRWGDYPEKLRISYIKGLIKTGTWFDDQTKLGVLSTHNVEPSFAPKYLLKNFKRYKYLLDINYAG